MGRGSARRFFLKGREGHRQSDEHWHCFKGNVGETSEMRVQRFWAFRAHRYHLELNKKGWRPMPCIISVTGMSIFAVQPVRGHAYAPTIQKTKTKPHTNSNRANIQSTQIITYSGASAAFS